MNTARILMPGVLRWRVMHPLLDADGSCTLIYDLERASVLEVPEELRWHVVPALETGDLDDDLLSWLINEDLLSTESWVGWAGGLDRGPLDSGSWWSFWAIDRFDDEVHARVSPLTEGEVREVLESVFRQSVGVARVQLLLDWNGTFPGAPLVERVGVEARQMAALAGQEASFELVLDSRKVTPAAAAFLTSSPLHVRLRCGVFPALGVAPAEQQAWASATAPLLLLVVMMDRINVQCSLAGGARLLDLWSWAKRSRIRHLEAVYADLSALADTQLLTVEAQYRHDLLAVGEEMASDLQARRIPVDYRPLTRMVRRLMGSEPRIEPESALDPDLLPCRACWARSLCNHSTLLAASVGDDRCEPSPERCSLWLAEAEAALRLYHRLAQCDPLDVLRLFGDSERMPLDPLGRREDPGTPEQRL